MSRWIEHCRQFSKKHEVSFRDAMTDSRCKKEYRDMKGGALPGNVKIAKAVLLGRNDLPPKVRSILKKHGNESIVSCRLKRTPVSKLLTSALSAISMGEFGHRLRTSEYDELFHLFVEFTTQQGKRFLVEKNQVINMDISPPTKPKEEVEEVVFPPGLTLNIIMSNTRKRMGSKFLNYNAKSNNCQDFIVALMKSNGIGNTQDIDFVKQDTDFLFQNLPYLRKISNTLTTLGARVDVLQQGAGF